MEKEKIDSIVKTVVEELGRRGQIGTRGGGSPPSPPPAGKNKLKIAVLGAGNSGMAMAGHLVLKGFPVNLWSFFDFETAPVVANGGIRMEGDVASGLAKPEMVTNCLDKAVRDVDLIMVNTPGTVHRTLASILGGLLRDGQIIVLNPGRTGGALEFARTLRRYALRAHIYLAEAQTFIYAAELRGPGAVEILKEKNKMRVAAFPANTNRHVIDTLTPIYPQIEAGQNVMETSINNVGPVNHPAPMLLNTSIIERSASGEDLRFYKDLITRPVVEMVMEKIDDEKVTIGKTFGLDAWTALDWYRESYGVTGPTLYDVYHNNPYYLGFHAPTDILQLNNILDEVPNCLVPLSCFGDVVGVETPAIDSVIHLACTMIDIDFWAEGRTLESLGLGGMSPEEIIQYVEEGDPYGRCRKGRLCRSISWRQNGLA
jgi:opine dehydrogenase